MDIEHLGYQTVTALMERGWVTDPADLYKLDAQKHRHPARLRGKIGAES
jgi:NAD-dependent DNA ligase